MFFPNHQGLYDVLAIVDACPRPFSVVAKKEVANVPLLKQTFKCMKAYMIDREDIRQSMQVIMDVTEEVKKGRNYLIFAEGTRSKMGNKLLEFKGGSFKAATKAKCPIIPIALIDSFKPFDTNSIAPVTVQVHFLEPIYYEEYQNMKSTEIAEVVKIKDIELEKYDLIIVPYECEEEYTLKNLLKNREVSPKKVLYIIGPEGGFDSEEIEYLKSKGANIVTLGKRILRAETASIVVGGILINEF